MNEQKYKFKSGDVIYISGPMTGYPNNNHSAFFDMEKKLRDKPEQLTITNPARIESPPLEIRDDEKLSYQYYIEESLNLLIFRATVLVFLEGWEKSKGARLEYHCASMLGYNLCDENFNKLEKNIKFDIVDDSPKKEESICQIADRLVTQDRQEQYGHPFQHFTDVGRIWGALLGIPDIKPETVGLMMTGLKAAREKNVHQLDNLIDGIGYFKVVDIIKKYRKDNNL